MSVDVFRYVVNGLQVAVILYCIVRSLNGLRSQTHPLVSVFFALGLLCFFVNDLYWLTHLMMGKGAYPPFSACDISAIGLYLLLSSALDVVFREDTRDVRVVTIPAVVFAACNTALWIIWSGEWFQQIVSGLAFACLLFSSARGLKCSGALSRREWRFLAAACGFLIPAEAVLPLLSGGVYKAVDLLCYGVMFGFMAFFLLRTIHEHRHGSSDAALGIAFAGYSWALVTLYLSAEPYYTVADTIIILFIGLMLPAVRRKAAET